MPTRGEYPSRSLEELYALAREIGPENVDLHDAEAAKVYAGSNTPDHTPASFYNLIQRRRLKVRRYSGKPPRMPMVDILRAREERKNIAA